MKEDSDIYSGFEDNISQIYNYDPSQDEAFLNAVKVSSYGKKVATPKFYYVTMRFYIFLDNNRILSQSDR